MGLTKNKNRGRSVGCHRQHLGHPVDGLARPDRNPLLLLALASSPALGLLGKGPTGMGVRDSGPRGSMVTQEVPALVQTLTTSPTELSGDREKGEPALTFVPET